MSFPSAADMRFRVTLQYNAGTVNELQGKDKNLQTLVTVWASIKPMSTYMKVIAGQMGVRDTHKITIRYQPFTSTMTGLGLNTSQRYRAITSDGHTYLVTGITDLEFKHRFLEL